MRMSLLLISTFSALGIAIVYDRIRQATGISIAALLWVSVGILIFGLCAGLRPKDVDKTETEES